jgi:hypothetical protein
LTFLLKLLGKKIICIQDGTGSRKKQQQQFICLLPASSHSGALATQKLGYPRNRSGSEFGMKLLICSM